MESDADRQFLITTAGEPLTLTSGIHAGSIFYGIPGFELERMVKGESSPYISERQAFIFQVTTADYARLNIAVDTLFTLSDGTYIMQFSVDRSFSDCIGFMLLNCLWIGKTNV